VVGENIVNEESESGRINIVVILSMKKVLVMLLTGYSVMAIVMAQPISSARCMRQRTASLAAKSFSPNVCES